ncbi:M23 family metallopeptidase [Entomospira entomophila]|uniref:M23 family metallopeptidase n=1 Tax=Entomospira entomophila TaxID=2719988 RepID=A0A968G9A3_9SPIO|nr:M23 family metallopeptidase [Entomospira entomophilus]NIZ40940.1 M23 family metallopeptidase [Entomospira entomophilus]WDI35153.1 M23 family metallopeptidase [Entomospira entomophilus]
MSLPSLKNRDTKNKVKQSNLEDVNQVWFRSSLNTSDSKKKLPTHNILKKPPVAIFLWLLAGITSASPFVLYPFLSREKVSATPILIPPTNNYTPTTPEVQASMLTVGNGEVLANAILRHMPDLQGVYSAVNTLGNHYNLRRIPVGQEVIITYQTHAEDQSKTLASVTITAPKTFQTTQVFRNPNNEFSVKQFDEYISQSNKTISGSIESSLYLSGLQAGAPANKLVEMFDLFAFSVDFQRDIHPGNEFDLVFEEYSNSNDEFIRAGNILAARLKLSSGTFESFRYEYAPGEVDYFDRNGSSVQKALLLMPVQGGRLTSGYSARVNPVYGYSEFHPALDFAAPMGTPIMSAGNGVVIHRGWDPKGYGNYVKVQHSNGLMTLYAHMSAFAASAPVGAKVRQGQTIGYVGSTGMSTGPHVHYEIWVNGQRKNPAIIVRTMSSGITLKGEELQQFKEHIHAVEEYFHQPDSPK